ncbi:MAG: HEAT repeat domain-containing protein [Simkaniaceae bacterium]
MVNSEIPLMDAIDMEILMHRDAHFGGNFEMMLEYYTQEGVGVMPDFELEEIKKLQNLENQMGKNLAETFLPEAAQEIVNQSKKLYQELRAIYSEENPDPIALLLSDLILSEEENPEKEIEALIHKGKEVVPPLIHLLSSHSFYDPLYPGYGRAPIFAAKCLGAIQDKRAIPPLFEALGQDNFFTDEEIIKALASFGKEAKTFLIKLLKQDPYSKDNEYAAIALTGFAEEEEIATACLEVLEKEATLQKPLFASYLVFACANLTQASEQERFIAISKKENLAPQILNEMTLVIRNWKKTV